jgi:hypothetical protein
MRAVQIALIVICIQVGMGLVTVSGLYGDMYYESKITSVNLPSNVSALTEVEQTQAGTNIMNAIWNTITWGWIKFYFEPLYSNYSIVKNFIDLFIAFLDVISGIIIGVAFLEFIRNRTDILPGG